MANHIDNNGALVTVREIDGEIYADSRDIARALETQHESVMRLLSKHKETLKTEFGGVRFQIGPLQTAGGPQQTRFALLNEEQALFVGNLSQNKPAVVRFKAALVKAFVAARRALEKAFAPAPSHADGMELAFKMTRASRLPAPGTPGYLELLDTHLQAVRQLVDLHKEVVEIKAEVVQTRRKVHTLTRENGTFAAEILNLEDARTADRPKLRAYEDFLSTSDGEYSWALAAKAFRDRYPTIGLLSLLRFLREEGVLIDGGRSRNTPYQQYINRGYFRVYHHPDFPDSLTTAVKPKGMAFLSRKLAKGYERPLRTVVSDSL